MGGWLLALAVVALIAVAIYFLWEPRRDREELAAGLVQPPLAPMIDPPPATFPDPEWTAYLKALQEAMVSLADSQRAQQEQLQVMNLRLSSLDEVQRTTDGVVDAVESLRAEFSGKIDALREDVEELKGAEARRLAEVVVEPVLPEPEAIPEAIEVAEVEEPVEEVEVAEVTPEEVEEVAEVEVVAPELPVEVA
ncbi:MAG TPA: hypothetical protein PKE55_06925, partial [Kiritimatiellia bacterium]|nr:hypothetical protein [Kiritimatiellia bacterium]